MHAVEGRKNKSCCDLWQLIKLFENLSYCEEYKKSCFFNTIKTFVLMFLYNVTFINSKSQLFSLFLLL